MLSILSRWLIQFCLCLDLTPCIPEISSFLMTSLLILSSLVYPLTLLRKRISAASRRVMSRFVVTHLSLIHKIFLKKHKSFRCASLQLGVYRILDRSIGLMIDPCFI